MTPCSPFCPCPPVSHRPWDHGLLSPERMSARISRVSPAVSGSWHSSLAPDLSSSTTDGAFLQEQWWPGCRGHGHALLAPAPLLVLVVSSARWALAGTTGPLSIPCEPHGYDQTMSAVHAGQGAQAQSPHAGHQSEEAPLPVLLSLGILRG